jgi:hypothetical protein
LLWYEPSITHASVATIGSTAAWSSSAVDSTQPGFQKCKSRWIAGRPVFADAKLADIPNTVRAAARQLGALARLRLDRVRTFLEVEASNGDVPAAPPAARFEQEPVVADDPDDGRHACAERSDERFLDRAQGSRLLRIQREVS